MSWFVTGRAHYTQFIQVKSTDQTGLNCLINICKQANVELVGCGVTVAKAYQRGIERIRELGYDVKVLAKIKALYEDGTIEIEEQDVQRIKKKETGIKLSGMY